MWIVGPELVESKKDHIRGCKQPPYPDIQRAVIAWMSIPELANLLSGLSQVPIYAEPLLREAGALSKKGSYRADVVGGCRIVRLKLDKSKELTRIRFPSVRYTCI